VSNRTAALPADSITGLVTIAQHAFVLLG